MNQIKLIRDLDRLNFEITMCEREIKRIKSSRELIEISLVKAESRLIRLESERKSILDSIPENEFQKEEVQG